MDVNNMGQIFPEKKYKFTLTVTSVGDFPDQGQWSLLERKETKIITF